MKVAIALTALTLSLNMTVARADDCQNMVELRNRSGSLDLALGKIDTGVDLGLIQNGDVTSQFLTVLLFESYICRLNQVLAARGQTPIARDVIDEWVAEINSAYATIDEATDGKTSGYIKASFNKASDTLLDQWKPAGAKAMAYQAKLPANVSKDFLAAVPATNLTTSVSGSAYVKTLFNQGFAGKYESAVTKGEELVGNQLYVLERMRTSVGVYAAGTTPAATMLRDIIKGVVSAVSQITGKHSEALRKDQMRFDAEAKAREAINSTASLKIAELEKRLANIEQKLQQNVK